MSSIPLADRRLQTLLDQLPPTPPNAQDLILAKLRAKLAQAAFAPAQRLARTLRNTYYYPSAMIELAKAQQQAGQLDAARRTLRRAQRHIQGFYEGDFKMGYPRADYLTQVAEAQVQLHDLPSAATTLASILPLQERERAMRHVILT
jgi:hypothetical protein